MASVAGYRPSLLASDEWFDFECSPCKADNVKEEAKYYCENCEEYLCDQCQRVHRKLKVTQSHKIKSSEKHKPGTTSRGTGPRVFIPCSCKTNNEVVFYCLQHMDVICDTCKIIKHHKCDTITIRDKSVDYSTKTFEELMLKANDMKKEFDRLIKKCKSNEKELRRLTDSCRKDIKAFRIEINTYLDRLEEDTLWQLNSYKEETEKRINQQVLTLKLASGMVESDCKLLENAKIDGRKSATFASAVQISKSLKDYSHTLADIASEHVEPMFSFQRNEMLSNLLREITTFGEITTKEEVSSKNTVVLLDRKVQSSRIVDVGELDDLKRPFITGIAVMPNGYTVLCDLNNQKIKLMGSSWSSLQSLKLSEPYDVTVIDDNHVIITRPNNSQLQYIQVNPVLKPGRVLQLDKKCFGVAVADGKIFTSCHTKGESGEVRILDFNGNIQRQICNHEDGSFIFNSPNYISVSKSGEKVFVSDYGTNTITCMSVDGHVMYTYKDSGLLSPTGILCDEEDNVFVCGTKSQTVQVITADGKKHETLLSSNDGIKLPNAIEYSRNDNSFIIGYNSNKLLLYKLNSC